MAVPLLAAALVSMLARPPVAFAASDKLLPSLVLGATGARVAVVVVPLDPKARQHAAELEQAAEGATERSGKAQLVPAQDAQNPTFAAARAEKLEQAAAKMAQGKKDLDDLDSAKAVEAFTEALELLKGADSTRDTPAMLDAWVMKAAAHATGGENGPAKKEIEAILPLDPKATFSSAFFSPDLIKFAEAQRRLAENAKGELTVRTEPPGARVWVDGQFRGTSPVLVAGLSAGKHLVAAAAGGFALTQVELPPGEHLVKLEPAEMAPALKQAAARVKADPEGPGRDAAAKDLGRALKVDQVLLVVAKKSPAGEQLDVIALRLDARDGHNWAYRQAVLKVGDEASMTGFFDTLYQRDDPRDGKAPRTHFKESGSSVKTTVGVSLIGAGVVAAATGAVFGVMALNQSNQFAQTPQTQVVKSETMASQGRTYAWVADISYIVAGVAAVTGGILVLTDKAESGDELLAPSSSGRKGLDPKAVEEERRRAQEQEKRDAARRAEERKREEEARERRKAQEAEQKASQADDAKALEEKKKAEEEEKRKADEEAKKKAEEEARGKKKTKKELQEEERRRKEEEKRQKAEEEKARREEEAAKKKGDEAKKSDDEAAKQRAEEEAAARKKAEEEAAAKKKAEEDAAKKTPPEKKKPADEDHDDLRNY